jgi:hypothetical protein
VVLEWPKDEHDEPLDGDLVDLRLDLEGHGECELEKVCFGLSHSTSQRASMSVCIDYIKIDLDLFADRRGGIQTS